MPLKLATTTSVFGAALASLLVAPELQADVVSLTFDPSTNPFVSSRGGGGGALFILINEVGAGFSQWNDSQGRTMYLNDEGDDDSGLLSIGLVGLSSTLSASTFAGMKSLFFSASSSGTQYVGFRVGGDDEGGDDGHGNVGWFSFSVAGFGSDINYLEGAYGNDGESVHVGTVPSPGALALLALGAVGIRRKRKRAA